MTLPPASDDVWPLLGVLLGIFVVFVIGVAIGTAL